MCVVNQTYCTTSGHQSVLYLFVMEPSIKHVHEFLAFSHSPIFTYILQLQPFYGPLDFVQDYLGEPVPKR